MKKFEIDELKEIMGLLKAADLVEDEQKERNMVQDYLQKMT